MRLRCFLCLAALGMGAFPAELSAQSATLEEMKAFAERGMTGNRYVAEEDRAKAMLQVGWMYYKGEGGAPQDFAEAARWFRRAADKGEGSAEPILGLMYFKGEGVVKNLGESFKWFNHAAARGIPNAAGNRDKVAAILISEYLARASTHGDPAPAVLVCQSDITAYDPASPTKAIGAFKEGTLLEVGDCPTMTGVKNATLRLPDGKTVQAVCLARDFEKGPVIARNVENPLKPGPVTFQKKAWGGEPDWKSVEDNPNYHGMKPKQGGGE